ncbi:uncharacterized protein [Nicotiana sylvestris]|uniref:uncharacterized protein n=1 Tax=Nicotiana sylvestris TaxID=4096 RepID=UPI00388CA9BA
MDKFVIRSNIGQSSSNGCSQPSVSSNIAPEIQRGTNLSLPSNVDSVLELGSSNPDLKERILILQYAPNIRDEVRRHYIQKGVCQPSGHAFPKTKFGNKMRQFNPDWFKGPYSQWLEYSIKGDASFCLCCYLFKNELESRGNAGDAFTKDGFKGWNKGTEILRTHVGEQSEKEKSDHRIRLNASVDVVRFLLRNGLSFRGHNESEDSEYKGLFLELLEFHGDKNFDVGKLQLTFVALSKKHPNVNNFFDDVTNTLNTIGASFKRREILRQHQIEKLEELLKSGEILTRQGLNQERGSNDGVILVGMLIFTNELNKALQKKDHAIVNAMRLLDLAKIRLQTMRESEFAFLMNEVYSFCVIDLQLHELNSRFDVVTCSLLVEYYPSEFDDNKLRDLSFQLDSFNVYARMPHSKFINLKGTEELAIVMAETKLDQTWCYIYLLVKLTLILPVATASVERAFSSMKLIKSDLRNSISEEFLNGCLVYNIELKVFATVSNDAIIDRFQTMSSMGLNYGHLYVQQKRLKENQTKMENEKAKGNEGNNNEKKKKKIHPMVQKSSTK